MLKLTTTWTRRIFRSSYLLFLTFLLLSSASQTFGQDGSNGTKGYVKMEVGAMGLHCPFLGVTLKDQLTADSSYAELKVDKSDHFLTFSYTKASKYTAAFFQSIAVGVGYPAAIIIITLSDEQPPIEERE